VNCLEFRRELQIHPQSNDAEFVRHVHECTRCAEAQQRALAFEGALKSALAVPAPAQLAEAILLKQATAQQHARQQLRRGSALLALAAGVVLAFGIGLRTRAEPLADLAVTHIDSEAFVLAMTKPVSNDNIRRAFESLGVSVSAELPADVSFVGCCPVGRYSAVHLVMPQANGPVSVLFVVDDSRETRRDFVRDGWLGRSVPMANGTLVLLGHDAGRFDRIENQWRTALQNSVRVHT